MTPEIERAFDAIRSAHGKDSIQRVEEMLRTRVPRHPQQKGAKWIMPGLMSKAWREPSDLTKLAPFLSLLESSHAAVKREIGAVLADRRPLEPYEHYLVHQDDWKALYLFRNGAPVEQTRAWVPVTYELMKEASREWLCPLLEMHFSILEPGAVIPPHCDLWNFTINVHLAVDIPEGCTIRVGDEERTWEEGRCLVFDYSFLHQAWNRGSRPRVCLLMDLWSPEVTLPERAALTAFVTEIRRLLAARAP
jgi:aspartyl/asparaginyl beta-hydroxylase (cupin superfamily)